MRGTAVIICGLLLAAGLARAGGVHVVKQKKLQQTRMYWAQYLTQTEIQVYPYPHGAAVGDQFDVADHVGYLGRVTITKVETQQTGCGTQVYYLATAQYVTTPSRQPDGTLIVFSPQARAAGRARVLTPQDLKNPPGDMLNKGYSPEVVLDWDGDRAPDLLRYYYDCPSRPGGRTDAYCMDTYAANGKSGRTGWTLLERYTITDCY